MQLIKHKPGIYYAKLFGGVKVRIKADTAEQAMQIAREARLPEQSQAAQVNALSAETFVRLTAGTRVTCYQSITHWCKWCATSELSSNTTHTYRGYIELFVNRNQLTTQPPTAITDQQLQQFVNPTEHDDDHSIKLSTRNARLSAIKSWFTFLSARGWVVGNPVQLIRIRYNAIPHAQKETKVRLPFTSSELLALEQIDNPFWRVAIQLSLNTGLRLTDVCQLSWSCFDWSASTITVWTDKSDVRVSLPLTPELQNELEQIPRTHREYVFPERRAMATDPRRRAALSVDCSRVLRSVGVSGKTFHNLRHTFATRLRQRDCESIDEIRKRLGHSSIETTQLYLHS